jgi:hypothetical protein
MDGLRWVGNLVANSYPELKSVVRSYPIQLRPAVGNDELHLPVCVSSRIDVPNASIVQRSVLVPEFSERQFRDYSLVGFNPSAFPSIVQNLVRLGSSAW